MVGGLRVGQRAVPRTRDTDFLEQLSQKLKKLDAQIKRAKADVQKQVKLMTVSRFTPEGYKLAEAKLKHLKAKVSELTAERKKLHHQSMLIA